MIALRDIPSSVSPIVKGQPFGCDETYGLALIDLKHARLDDGTQEAWDGIQWPGATVVILASGPSLTIKQCEAVSDWREGSEARRTIAVNTTFRRAPWADVLYACDAPWWRLHYAEVQQVFNGALWTQDKEATREFGVNRVESANLPGLGKRTGVIHQGANSGYQAVNLAYQAGVKKIILLGFDMQGTHWHGPYTNGLPNTAVHLFSSWIKNFERLAADLAALRIDVVNCTPGSALKAFPAGELAEALA